MDRKGKECELNKLDLAKIRQMAEKKINELTQVCRDLTESESTASQQNELLAKDNA